jgi:predicted dehydrogenase
MAALEAGKHVFIEKPMTDSPETARQLVEEAERRGKLIFVDHTFVYTGAVTKIKSLVIDGSVGELQYYDSVRINLGLFQSDVNVIWDLAVHDISILDHIMPTRPVAVSCQAARMVENQPESLAYVTLFYNDNVMAHVHVSWLSPVKIRQALIGGRKRMIVYDDLEPSEKVKVYDRGIELVTDQAVADKLRVAYRSGDMMAPNLDTTEALQRIAQHFNECIASGRQPVTDGAAGLRVVAVLAAAQRSIAERGTTIAL